MSALQKQLKVVNKEVKNKRYDHRITQFSYFTNSSRYLKDKELSNFQRDCHNFFMEVVSTLCFGGQSAPEPELIKSLMEIVFTEDSDLVSPITETGGSKSDKVSVVKSSMLQLLLEHKYV